MLSEAEAREPEAEAEARKKVALPHPCLGCLMGVARREHLYKILVIGELGTGKTSIIKRYVRQFFSQHYRATIGVDFALKVLNWDANTVIRLQLWDIAGQERFENMTRVYYKEAVGCLIVFDASRTSTFEAVLKWKQDLDNKVVLPDGSSIPCVLLANKCDLSQDGIVADPGKMDDFCKEKGFVGWFETSAKESVGIEEAAQFLVSKILANEILSNLEPDSPDRIALSAADSGNTCDLPKDGIVADPGKMDDFCKEKGFVGWFETSAKENVGIEEAAQFLVSKILANDIWSNLEPDSPDRIALSAADSGNTVERQKCSC
ncbi:unnamed protein product [Cyprideis torosa]|uniref:Ras-related protein Rab n=1 Tax=Cyprideis torosa TaxID=163714 RepID=A0A7R8WA24_9CRUS|nr:unnamed protein product [Cyprideis torosa]CAG0885435.1 unnamed protein product [Cyprideis torosa]